MRMLNNPEWVKPSKTTPKQFVLLVPKKLDPAKAIAVMNKHLGPGMLFSTVVTEKKEDWYTYEILD